MKCKITENWNKKRKILMSMLQFVQFSMNEKRMSKQYLAVGNGDNEIAFRMGLGKWRPNWIQRFNSIRWFMFLLAIFSLVQGR